MNRIPPWQPSLVPGGLFAVKKGRCFHATALPGGYSRGAKAAFIFHWGSPGAQWTETAEGRRRNTHCLIRLTLFLIWSFLCHKGRQNHSFIHLCIFTLTRGMPRFEAPGVWFSSSNFNCFRGIYTKQGNWEKDPSKRWFKMLSAGLYSYKASGKRLVHLKDSKYTSIQYKFVCLYSPKKSCNYPRQQEAFVHHMSFLVAAFPTPRLFPLVFSQTRLWNYNASWVVYSPPLQPLFSFDIYLQKITYF